jgi:hypothetical protein
LALLAVAAVGGLLFPEYFMKNLCFDKLNPGVSIRQKALKYCLLATQPAALVEVWVEFIEISTAFFAIGCSVAACIEINSV